MFAPAPSVAPLVRRGSLHAIPARSLSSATRPESAMKRLFWISCLLRARPASAARQLLLELAD